MKRNSIKFKLFITTIAFFILFISATLFFQSAFFEKFYTNSRIRKIERGMEKIKAAYTASSGNNEQTASSIRDFQNSNNSKVAIISRDSMYNYAIISGNNSMTDDPIKEGILKNAILEWSKISKSYGAGNKTGKYIVYNIHQPVNNTNYIVVILPAALKGGINYAIISVSSLEPVGEAVSTMNEFYIYLYLAAILLIIILSLIYSNMISKPLVSLNKTARKMAELDFTTKSDIKSNDEVGSLSDTLNFLSDKLDTTIKELNSANDKLKSDIDHERNLEKMHKEFVAGVSHELKTPISIIEGYAEGLKDGIAEDYDKDFYIDVIIDEAKKMGDLVSDMLDLSQLDTGNYKLNPRDFYIYDLVYEIVKRYSNILKQKKITVSIDTFAYDVSVYADRLRIEQVIYNIFTNAVKHTEGNGKIIINIKDSISEVIVEIENEGEHIPEDELDKIWDRFYKVDKSRNRNQGGTGLGLAIAKNILTLQKSKFGVLNTEIGVLFYFSLQKSKKLL